MKRCCHLRVPDPPAHDDWIYVWARCICGCIITRYHYGEIGLGFDARKTKR